MTKKDTLSLLIILCLTSLLLSAAYFLTPHAVVRSPEHTQLSVIHMDSPNGSGTSYSWVPTTEEDQAIAQKIVEYLSSAQERYTFQRTLYGGYPRRLGCDDPYALHARRKYPRHRFGPSRIPVLPRQRCFRELFLSIFSPSLFPQCSDLYPNPPGRNSSLC